MIVQRHDREQLAAILLWQGIVFIDDERVAEALHLVVGHRLEETEGERIGEDAVLLEALAVVAALDVMKAAGIAAVVAGVKPAERIDLDAERVAAAFREDFEDLLLRMVTPNVLADQLNRQR